MPPGFDYPVGTDVWTPLGNHLGRIFERDGLSPARQRGLGVLFVLGRLNPNVSVEEARTELTGIVQRLGDEYAGSSRPAQGVRVQPLVAELLGNGRPVLLALWGAVGLVLLLACCNVAALLLVRVLSRGREYSIKLALGAPRLRLVRLLVAEVALITLLGAALGWWMASAGMRLLVHLSASQVPRIQDSMLGSEAVVFLAVVVFVAVSLVGTAPAALCVSRGAGAALGDVGHRFTESRRATRLRQRLVTAQIAIAVVLLVGASLTTRSLVNLQQTDLGYDTRNALAFDVAHPEAAYSSHRSRRALYRELLNRLNGLPGVIAAAAMSNRPFLHGQVGADWTFHVEGQAPEERQNNPRAVGMVVSTDYFRTMRLELVRGRVFTEADDGRAERVIVVGERLARHAWPSQDPIGKKLCCGWSESGENPWLTVVGVVENARYRDVYAPRLDVYEHYLQGWSQLPNLLVRTHSDPLRTAGGILEQVRAVDPRLSVEEVTTLGAVVGVSRVRRRRTRAC